MHHSLGALCGPGCQHWRGYCFHRDIRILANRVRVRCPIIVSVRFCIIIPFMSIILKYNYFEIQFYNLQDIHDEKLLISTTTRSLIMTLSSRETVQVGKRPRDGLFGACFHPRLAGAAPVVYSARPGGRLWEASLQGGVVSTLRLRDLVTAPSSPIYGAGWVWLGS